VNDVGKDRDLILVGAGKMGMALLDGWLSNGIRSGQEIAVIEPNPNPGLEALVKDTGLVVLSDPSAADLTSAGAVILAVKPQVLAEVLSGLPIRDLEGAVFISIAAGISVAAMAEHLGESAPIIRAMPNTPASIGKGITGYYASTAVTAAQKKLCQALLSSVGQTVELSDESEIDMVTAVSGSGPAYVFYLIECMAEAGRQAGLDEAVAMELAKATVEGAGALAMTSETSPSDLRRNVTSPGGTTEAALKILQSDEGLQKLISDAVSAAVARAKELNG